LRQVMRTVLAVTLAAGLAALPSSVSYAEPPAVPSAQPVEVFGSYVALGDSYVAGPLVPVQTGMPPGCQRSNNNYPSTVQVTLRASNFADVSCSGATTEHITAQQRVNGGVNPPQQDALSGDTRLVTLGIGGNDIGFGEIVATCASKSPTAPLGAACRDFYQRFGHDVLADRIAATAPKVAAVLRGIRQRASSARVLVVGYPTILPDSGPGCFPVVPFSPGDVAYLRQTTKALNDMLAEQARQAGAEFVDTYRSSVGHDICQPPGTKWVEGLVPTSPAAPVHPNALGMRNSANEVLNQLKIQVLAGR
jgi:lysophospholipase L1-like esterase